MLHQFRRLRIALNDQLLSYLLKHNLLYEWQSGFHPHYLTQDVLLNVTDSWHFWISKAFDCVNHDILLSKLACYGILEHSLVWFTSYLSCRRQQECLQGVSSVWGKIHVDVPQGSILGPLLFSICDRILENLPFGHKQTFQKSQLNNIYPISNIYLSNFIQLHNWIKQLLNILDVKFHTKSLFFQGDMDDYTKPTDVPKR